MSRGESSAEDPVGQSGVAGQPDGALSGPGVSDFRDALQRLAAAGRDVDPFERTPPPSRRYPRRPDVLTYRVRVDLDETKPPVWRRLELASDLYLDEIHEIIQAAFGWTDSHLHRFGSGPDYYSPDTEYYLCPFETDEGEVGIPEHEVRLDEVLSGVGSRLFYEYDFGDDWMHLIKLEAIRPRDESAPRAACTAGRRPGPPEDCGGVYGYELIAAATDPDNADHAAAVAEFEGLYGPQISPGAFEIVPFDLDEVNGALDALGIVTARPAGSIPEPLEELVGAIRATTERRQLRQLIGDALATPPRVDADSAARMVRPYSWLLDRVGADGITLTTAGYLPPAHVAAAVADLGLADEWIGTGNRENQTLPVLNLRESAVKTGLLRKHRGRLLLTARGRAAAADPLALWWQLAERMPIRSADAGVMQAGLILLIIVAAQSGADPDTTIMRFLAAMGWMSSDGTPLTRSMAAYAAWDTSTVLRRLGAFAEDRRSGRPAGPTTDGVTFARAALRTWPADPRRAGGT
jgi:hypothetical protein